ncbi:hypothetical protein M409DRAFT_22852 [Zasmidium cellare ATCC 36951]|uniref:Fe2OG dioxygenase domain-containing protein n=1 Tax=Zasmidium cellare ATCC 36951 TaxID=1080233 RepID=A0A6A6CKQ9_ZASCE|nr:uncharacterized protein M409DRAFT_22852 [Zasmidium cellare ATCC 36951]KAF2166798.1 hypothetical protein M409DRAFT_22852 [Zasmidium cellare ATCC 36951]
MAPVLIDTTPKSLTANSTTASQAPVEFDANKHLAYSPPCSDVQMHDLGYPPTELSSVAHTQPFPLLSAEAILQHRRELFNKETLDNCMHHTRPGSIQIRGAAPRYAPFIHQFWHSKEVLDIISKHAGVDLVPAMDYEISHCNAQLGPDGLDGVRATPVEPPVATEETIASFDGVQARYDRNKEDANPVIEWHKDSHPFVCVIMLSDARHMTGGETELQCADGRTVKVKAPQMGYATILQGRYITHLAIPACNMPERITIVTSFRPRDPTLLDETTNMNIRNKSHLTELYYQWTTYRLRVLEQRVQLARKALESRYAKNVQESDPEGKLGLCKVETVDIAAFEQWALEQIKYLEQTGYEMRPLESKNGRVW